MTPYRDDYDALKARHASLSEELETIRKKTREMADLMEAEARLARELEDLEQKLERIPPRRSLPLLESIRIASPCKADWDEMIGDDQVRFCVHCQKDVYNLSGMAREEAEQLVRDREGNICVRLYRRADGTVMTSDCPVGVRRKRVKQVATVAVGGGLLAAGALLALQSSNPIVDMNDQAEQMAMGMMVPTVPPAPPPPPAEEGYVMGDMPAPSQPHVAPPVDTKVHVRMGRPRYPMNVHKPSPAAGSIHKGGR